MTQDNFKEVDFSVYCPCCKHWSGVSRENPNIGVYDGDKWSGVKTFEEYTPCCYCLEEGAREGTAVPLHWESKR